MTRCSPGQHRAHLRHREEAARIEKESTAWITRRTFRLCCYLSDLTGIDLEPHSAELESVLRDAWQAGYEFRKREL